MKLFYFALCSVIFMSAALSSCKEGCKDKTALNYDARASEENGSCLYCKTTIIADSSFLVVQDSNAPFINKNVLEFIVHESGSSVAGNGCQSHNLQTGMACGINLQLLNLTNKVVSGNFDLQFFQGGFESWDYQGFISLQPNGTLNYGVVSDSCSNFTTGIFNPFVSGLSYN